LADRPLYPGRNQQLLQASGCSIVRLKIDRDGPEFCFIVQSLTTETSFRSVYLSDGGILIQGENDASRRMGSHYPLHTDRDAVRANHCSSSSCQNARRETQRSWRIGLSWSAVR